MARSILETDAYKFSMQEAGYPLRKETFVYFHRKGGPQVVPFDIESKLMSMWPSASKEDYDYLAGHEYEMGVGFKSVFSGNCRMPFEIRALPRYSIFYPGEPIFTITGPSALVSWFEPLVLQLSWQIQLATIALRDPTWLAREIAVVTCEQQKEIALETLDAVGIKPPPITVNPGKYIGNVIEAVHKLREVVNLERVFEVGLRSATCMQQHDLVLQGIKAAGIQRTSNVAGAKAQGMIPVGTMGHEHPQRHRGDENAFRAMKDRRPYRSSFLTDTYDPYQSGIPAAIRVMREDPKANDSMRFDSDNKRAEYVFAIAKVREHDLDPRYIIESELDVPETKLFENLRETMSIAEDRQFYGYGKFFVSDTGFTMLTRDRVSAVYKLSQTGPWPTMKFSEHKQSLPGRPVVFRRTSASGPMGIVGQEGEKAPDGYALWSDKNLMNEKTYLDSDMARQLEIAERQDGAYAVWSPATQALRDKVKREADRLKNELRLEELQQ